MNSHQQFGGSVPFWDFVQSFDPDRATGHGVDHQSAGPGFPFGASRGTHRSPPWTHHGPAGPYRAGPWNGGPEWGSWHHHGHGHGHGHRGGRRHGPRGHSHNHNGERYRDNEDAAQQTQADANAQDTGVTPGPENEKASTSEHTLRDENQAVPDPAEVTPGEEDDEEMYSPPHPCGPGRGRGHCRRGGPRRACRQPGGGAPSFGWPGVMHGIMNHPFFQGLRDQAERYAGENHAFPDGPRDEEAAAFPPPVDVFNTADAYIVHVALPGARKEDVGVDWDPDTSRLRVAGVVHRPGDEHLLEGLVSAERRVGLFERHVDLPPAGVRERDPVDGSHITARMQDGVLVVTVPKLEKEWTEIRRVDIE